VRKLRVAVSTVARVRASAFSACDHVPYIAGVSVAPPPPLVYGPAGVAPEGGWGQTDITLGAVTAGCAGHPILGMSGGNPITSVTATATAFMKDTGCATDMTVKRRRPHFIAGANACALEVRDDCREL